LKNAPKCFSLLVLGKIVCKYLHNIKFSFKPKKKKKKKACPFSYNRVSIAMASSLQVAFGLEAHTISKKKTEMV